MIRFLVVGSVEDAAGYAEERGWTRIGLGRYVTPGRDDVRVVERPAELFWTSGGVQMIRGPGFEEMLTSPEETPRAVQRREYAEAIERMVEDGGARWVDADA